MNILQEIETQFIAVETSRNEMKGRIKLLIEQKGSAEKESKQLTHNYKIQERILDIFRKYAVIKEQVLREKIDKIVTRGLRLIFGEGYRSKLEFGISRGQAVIIPKIITEVNGEELETGIADAHGGGVTNICSFLYQAIMLALVRPRQKQILFLDETFRNLSTEYLEATGAFLKEISEKLGIQIVLITHRRELIDIADVGYKFSNINGITQAERI